MGVFRNVCVLPLVALILISVSPPAGAQEAPFQRSSLGGLDVMPPSERVAGSPGQMTVVQRECSALAEVGARRRIVDVAVQEWAYFGFPIMDQVHQTRLLPPNGVSDPDHFVVQSTTGFRRMGMVDPEEAARVAASIAGYWAVTPEGPGIVSDQNRAWNGPQGAGSRWVAPWSAAFVSWVLCEAGFASTSQFQRAIAHRTYIDQAIRARDGNAPQSAYVAYDIGEMAVEPGDLLCAGRRPVYRNIAERRSQMGVGASSHCDIVVKVDDPGQRILAIGGNVLRSVSLKVLPAAPRSGGGLQPASGAARPLFAHLKLRADPIEPDALDWSPALAAFSCPNGQRPQARVSYVMASLEIGVRQTEAC